MAAIVNKVYCVLLTPEIFTWFQRDSKLNFSARSYVFNRIMRFSQAPSSSLLQGSDIWMEISCSTDLLKQGGDGG